MARDMVFEDVPRLNRRVGDNVLAGSNNATLLLGRDRVDSVDSGYGDEKGTGAAHLVVGRKSENVSVMDDAASLYLSAKTDPDGAVGTESIGDKQRGVSALVGRADCIRLSARQDFKVSVGKAYFRISKDGTIVAEGDVSLGEGAAQRIIRGDLFTTLWSSHTHPTPMGISGPPVQPMTSNYLSPRNKVT